MKKFLPIILGVLIAGAGFFAYTQFLSGGSTESPAKAQAKQRHVDELAKKKRIKDGIEGQTVALGDPFTVNLADSGAAHFAQFNLSLEVDKTTPLAKAADGAAGAAALEDAPEIRDIVIDVVSSHSTSELTTAAGRAKAKSEIIAAVDAQTEHTVALAVYFTSFAVQ